MPNGLSKLKALLDSSIGPPKEGIKLLSELTSGETSKRIDKLLVRVENISKNSSALPQVIELLKLIQEMDKNGALDKLNELLKNIPKGKQGQVLVTELRQAIAELALRLDKISAMISTLMKE